MRFWRNALRIGLPFGVVFAFFAALTNPSRLACALIGVAGALTQGLLGAAALRRIPQTRRWVHHVLAGVILGCTAAMLAFLLWMLILPCHNIPHGRWRRLADPPEPIESIVGHSAWRVHGGGVLYVKGASGAIYGALDATDSVNEGEIVWERVDALPELSTPDSLLADEFDRDRAYATPIAPGRIVSQDTIHVASSEMGRQIDYAVLDDGSLWRTTYSWAALGYALWFVVGIVGTSLFGLAQGLTAPWYILRREHEPDPA